MTMMERAANLLSGVVLAQGEAPRFCVGDRVRVSTRSPIGHYRVPTYVRGKTGVVEKVVDPPAMDNEEEGFGRNAGSKRHYYRVAFTMPELWPGYADLPADGLRIEVFETWLEREIEA
jgi:nitrile hydratase